MSDTPGLISAGDQRDRSQDSGGSSELVSVGQNLVQAVNALNQTMKVVFPLSGATSATATVGAGAATPANVDKFLTVTLPDGTSRKIPLYLP